MNKLSPWSFTNLGDFANCRHKFFRKHVAKDLPKEAKSPEQLAGIEAHAMFEKWINQNAWGDDKFYSLVKPILAMGATAERKYGMALDGKACGFFMDPWGRGVVDVEILRGDTAVLFDWKTGKVREDDRELKCQALLLKANNPHIKKVTGAYIWLRENRMGAVYDLSNTDRAMRANITATEQMQDCLEKDRWAKSPNPLCGCCPVKDCEHNRS